MRPIQFAVALGGGAALVGGIVYGGGLWMLALATTYVLSWFTSARLARELNRSAAGWVVLAVLLPVLAPLLLALATARHADSLTHADTAWARMDTPSNKMVITAVLMFDEPLDFSALQGLVEEKLVTHDRFRRVVVDCDKRPRWQDYPAFALADHLVQTTLLGEGTEEDLQAYVSEQMGRSLNPERPLWLIHHVSNYGGGTALVVRIHHCVGDGIALIRLLLSLTNADQVRSELAAEPQGAGPVGVEAYEKSNEIMRSLSGTRPFQIRRFFSILGKLIVGALRINLAPPDRKSCLKGDASGHKLTCWSKPIPLDDVKRAGRLLGCKLNDVLMAALAGALRRYMQTHQQRKLPKSIRLFVPVDLRPKNDPQPLGNRFSTVLVPIPVGLATPQERFRKMQREMNRIKRSLEPVVAYGLTVLLGMMPKKLEMLFLRVFAAKASGVMSNVPGPRAPISMAGTQLSRIMFWVPQTFNSSMGVSILSYSGDVMIGITTDRAIIDDAKAVVDAYLEEVQSLVAFAESASASE